MSLFRTADLNYDGLRAEISFVTDLQLEIEAAMDVRGVTQAELAKRLNVSEARVSQILADNGANLEARTVARIARALGFVPSVKFADANILDNGQGRTVCMKQFLRTRAAADPHAKWGRVVASNENGWVEGRSPPREVVGA